MCNVVVSGDKPYPENANYYVKSAKSYKITKETSPTTYNRLTFLNNNGIRVEILPVEVTQEEFNAGHARVKLKNADTGEIIDDYTFTSKTDKYIIGSLQDESYL